MIRSRLSIPYRFAFGPGVFLWLALLGGCGTSDGSAAAGEFPPLVAVEELRIGSVDDPDVGFARIGSVDVDDEGRIYVFERIDNQIRVYSSTGQMLRVMGGPGEGPGEFRSFPRIGVLGDTVWALEAVFGVRVTLFDRDGELLAARNLGSVTVDLPGFESSGTIVPWALNANRLLIGHLSILSARPGGGSARTDADGNLLVPRVRFDLEGAVVDTVGWQGYWPPINPDSRYIEAGPTRYYVPSPERDTPLIVPMPEGWFRVDRPRPGSPDPTEFQVTRHTDSGDTVYARSYPYEPQPYAPNDLDSIAWQSARIPGAAFDPVTGPRPTPEGVDIAQVAARIQAEMEFPEFKVPVNHGRAGDDGTLWLRTENEVERPTTWRILRPDGTPRGLVELPRSLGIPVWTEGDTFLAVETDDLGVPWLIRFRLEDA